MNGEYRSPLQSRYASHEMCELFSPHFKFTTWRKLWLALAKGEKKVGLPIEKEQIEELEAHIDTIDFEKAHAYEKQSRHEVVAHIKAYADDCPKAAPIIHLGATSSYVMDNTVLIQMRAAIDLLLSKFLLIFSKIDPIIRENANLPCLSYTHFQAAQPTTIGKRLAGWLQDLLSDYHELKTFRDELRFLGVKGATGTQASFLSLLGNDERRVRGLEKFVANEMGFDKCYTIATQTYPRKLDMTLLGRLAGLGASAHKIGNDIRLLSHLGEICEPFGSTQVGSSAMPFKRNPILCERACSLGRYLISHFENGAYTASLQWLERTLDDSANRRLAISEAFLTADATLNILHKVLTEIKIFPKRISHNLEKELPFLGLESLLMRSVEKGGDRQHTHEKLRTHSTTARLHMLEEGDLPNFLDTIANDPEINLNHDEVKEAVDVENFIGLAANQTLEFLDNEIKPLIKKTPDDQPDINPEV